MVILLFILLSFQTYFYLKVDKIIYGTFITPVSVLSIPYLLVLLSHILFHKVLDFKQVSALSVLVWNIGTLIFWLVGLLVAKFVLKKKVSHPFTGIRGIDIHIKGLHRIILTITSLFIFIMLYSLYRGINSMGFNKINSEEFALIFAGGGVFGYTLMTLRYILIYLIVVTSKKKTITNLFILLIIVFCLLYQVKGWLLIPILAAILIRFIMMEENKGKISKIFLKKMSYVALLGGFLFALSYYISLGAQVPFRFIFTHFLHYLWSGIIGFSEYLNSDVPIGGFIMEVFNPIVNVFNKISGKEMSSALNPYFFSTYDIYYKGSNVTTFFGSILVSSGVIWTIIIICTFSIVNYGIFIMFLINKTVFSLVLYAFFLTGLFFGWFDFYFRHLIFYVIILITFWLNSLLFFSKPIPKSFS